MPRNPSTNQLNALALILLVTTLLASCTKSAVEDGIGAEFVGEWELSHIPGHCETTPYWIDCGTSGYYPTCSYTLIFTKKGRVISEENGNEIWRDKLTEVSLLSEQVYGYRTYMRFETGGLFGDAQVVYLTASKDTLYIDTFPDPDLTSSQNPQLGQKKVVYVRK